MEHPKNLIGLIEQEPDLQDPALVHIYKITKLCDYFKKTPDELKKTPAIFWDCFFAMKEAESELMENARNGKQRSQDYPESH